MPTSSLVAGRGDQPGHSITRDTVPPLPLGVLVAATEGWIGYMIQQSLQNALARGSVQRQVVTIITQAMVDPSDPALDQATKPVGKPMDEPTARAMAAQIGSQVAENHHGWRCVVPSPRPIDIIEAPMICELVNQGHVVIAAGGGGAPVYADPALGLEGLDAVVDKDRAAAILGREINADVLLILTDVDGVYEHFGEGGQKLIRRLTVDQAEALLAQGGLGAGSMAPKVEAAATFIRNGGIRAIIARLDQGQQAVAGQAGTEITAE